MELGAPNQLRPCSVVARILRSQSSLHAGIAESACIAEFNTVYARLVDVNRRPSSDQIVDAVIEIHRVKLLLARSVTQSRFQIARAFRL